jgi:indole-3-glycerol phosphate synthase
MGFLTDLLDDLRRRLEHDPLDEPGLLALAIHLPPPRPFEDALRSAPPALIAEYKRSSPSAGAIAEPDVATKRAPTRRGERRRSRC